MVLSNGDRGFQGSLTDLNVWSGTLEDNEMIDFTSCRAVTKGDLISWDINKWKPASGFLNDKFKIEPAELESICKGKVKPFVVLSR